MNHGAAGTQPRIRNHAIATPSRCTSLCCAVTRWRCLSILPRKGFHNSIPASRNPLAFFLLNFPTPRVGHAFAKKQCSSKHEKTLITFFLRRLISPRISLYRICIGNCHVESIVCGDQSVRLRGFDRQALAVEDYVSIFRGHVREIAPTAVSFVNNCSQSFDCILFFGRRSCPTKPN